MHGPLHAMCECEPAKEEFSVLCTNKEEGRDHGHMRPPATPCFNRKESRLVILCLTLRIRVSSFVIQTHPSPIRSGMLPPSSTHRCRRIVRRSVFNMTTTSTAACDMRAGATLGVADDDNYRSAVRRMRALVAGAPRYKRPERKNNGRLGDLRARRSADGSLVMLIERGLTKSQAPSMLHVQDC